MNSPVSQKTILLILGDILVLYGSLIVALFFRYGTGWQEAFGIHFGPFSFMFALWLLIFYIAGLYDLRRLKNNITFLSLLSLSLVISSLITIALFYFLPWFGIAPRTTLSLFILVFVFFELIWRRFFNVRLGQKENLFRVLFVGDNSTMNELAATLRENPQMGYTVISYHAGAKDLKEGEELKKKLHAERVDIVVVPRGTKQNTELQKVFYDLLASGIAVYDVAAFYEEVFRKIPLNNVEESWFLEHISIRRNVYDDLRHISEVIFATLIAIIILPVILFLAFLVRISSRGPVIFAQKRVGAKNRIFTLYKFRTMRALAADGSAETTGAEWAKDRDPRITFIGRILRYSHLDELPQIWNIIRGDISFVGPRPERPEFVALLEKEIPYYDIRHLILPGLTGWAQINYPYGSSVQDSYEKLQYDIYYLKNRSLILDVAVILKTLRTLFIN